MIESKRSWVAPIIMTLVAVLGVAALLFPAVKQAQQAARRTSHNCYLKQIGRAMHNYHDVYQTFPLPAVGDPAFSWRVAILPYVDQNELYGRYQFAHPWDSEENEPIACTHLPICHWEGDLHWHDRLGRNYSSIAMITGPCTIWEDGGPMVPADIADGISNTILAGEAVGWKIVWTEPRDIDVREVTWDINRPGPLPDVSDSLLSSTHVGGAYVLLADGSVRFLSQQIEPQVLKALVSPKGHDAVGEFWQTR